MPRIMHAQPVRPGKGVRECTELDRKIIEKILTDPEARKLAEEFIRKTAAEGVA